MERDELVEIICDFIDKNDKLNILPIQELEIVFEEVLTRYTDAEDAR